MLFLLVYAVGLSASPSRIEMTELELGRPSTVQIIVTNPGDRAVKVKAVRIEGEPGLTVSAPERVRIAPGGSMSVDVTAALTAPGQVSATVFIESKGETLEVPVLAQSPAASAENAGVLGALSPEAAAELGIGGLIGAQGTQLGTGGLGSRPPSEISHSAGPGGPKVTLGNPIILGALDKSAIDAVLKESLDGALMCYTAELPAKPDLKGNVAVKFTINPNGRIKATELKSSTLGSPDAEACVQRVVGQQVFPEVPGGGLVIASYTYSFSPR